MYAIFFQFQYLTSLTSEPMDPGPAGAHVTCTWSWQSLTSTFQDFVTDGICLPVLFLLNVTPCLWIVFVLDIRFHSHHQLSTLSHFSSLAAKMANTAAQELIQRHPLQRLESPSRGASALLHVSNTSTHECTLHSILTNIPDHWLSILRLLILLPRAQPKSNVRDPSANIRPKYSLTDTTPQ